MADQRSVIYRNMCTMLDAGLDILRVFKLVNQGLKGRYGRIWRRLERAVTAGSSISDGMKEQSKSFEKIDISMVAAAERSGNLPKVLELLSNWYEFRHRIITKILSGLIFPIFILNIAAFVFPVPDLVLGDIDGSGYFSAVWATLKIYYVPAACILVILYMRKKISILGYVLDYLVLWIPALGKGVYNLSLSMYARSFYMFCSAGLGAIETAETATELTGNFFVKSLVKGGGAAVRGGKNASEGFNAEQLPAEFMDLWRVGEESGTMDKVSLKLADLTAERAEFWFSCFATWLPKIVYALVCIKIIMLIFKRFGALSGGLGVEF
ncbi:MAG TPA: type II secretion system F family protein [Sedimentisphaerales bacterium]|nr:type II secretion system F family protein [Sedimentisphaerales bacterium]